MELFFSETADFFVCNFTEARLCNWYFPVLISFWFFFWATAFQNISKWLLHKICWHSKKYVSENVYTWSLWYHYYNDKTCYVKKEKLSQFSLNSMPGLQILDSTLPTESAKIMYKGRFLFVSRVYEMDES